MAKAKSLDDFQCDFCKKSFKQERTLLNHSCEKKRRWLYKDEKYSRMAFHAFQKFYSLAMRSRKTKTIEDFINSHYYLSFVKFGKHLISVNALEPDGFIEFLIKAEVKITDWSADWAYETWIRELSKKESPERAITRSIQLMEQWSREYNEPWQDFLTKVTPSQATQYIKSGRLSPWLLYTGQGHLLFDRMTDEQLSLVKEWISPVYWNMKIRDHREDVDLMRQLLKESGL